MKSHDWNRFTLKNFIITLCLAIFCSGLTTLVYIRLEPVQYRSGLSLYISNRSTVSGSVVSNADLMASRSLAGNYAVVLQSQLFADKILRALHAGNVQAGIIRSGISAQPMKESNILDIRIRQADRLLSQQIAETVPLILATDSADLPDAPSITVLSKTTEATPEYGGVVAAAVIPFISIFLGVSILLFVRPGKQILRTPEDVERVLGLKVSGTIPDYSF